jgi:hypothetical protein
MEFNIKPQSTKALFSFSPYLSSVVDPDCQIKYSLSFPTSTLTQAHNEDVFELVRPVGAIEMPRIGTSYKESGFTVGGSSSALGKKKTEAYEFYMSD